MPRPLIYILVILVIASWIPLALIARARVMKSDLPRVHWFQDMDIQPKYKGQALADVFADHRSMRPPPVGTVARGGLRADDHYYRGRVIIDDAEQWADGFPAQIEISEQLVRRGQDRFNIYCATCHGMAGEGNGPIALRADKLDAGKWGWVPPTSLHDKTVLERPNGHIFNTITYGIRSMAAYGTQVSVADRWAIIAYVRALQFSRQASMEDVPPEKRDALR